MSTLQSGHLRSDINIMRTSLDPGSVIGGGLADAESVYRTHNQTAFSTAAGVALTPSKKHAGTHKNFSQLPGFGDPPNGSDYFTTTSGSSFMQSRVVPAPTPRYNTSARGVQPTDPIGVRGVVKRRGDPPSMSAATAMGQSTQNVLRQPQPRYVHGGGYRNSSAVALDKNLMTEGMMPTDFSTMSHNVHSYNAEYAPKNKHRFDLPQKNTSTFLSTSLTVGASGPSAAPAPAASIRNLTTTTNHHQAYPALLKSGSARHDHYNTSHASHYMPTDSSRLTIPPGKGGVDMTRSSVPLGRATGTQQAMETAHSASMFTGQQVPEHARMRTCPSRGTLGTRMGRIQQ